MGKRGPKPKPEGDLAVKRSFSFPPEVWREIEEAVPAGERSKIVQACLLRAARKAKREVARD